MNCSNLANILVGIRNSFFKLQIYIRTNNFGNFQFILEVIFNNNFGMIFYKLAKLYNLNDKCEQKIEVDQQASQSCDEVRL